MAKWTVADIPSQAGKVAVVTGGNSGIGWYTALELARAGCEVILTARTEAKGANAVERIRQVIPQAAVRFAILDLASLQSVRSFGAEMNQLNRLDLLVNNAGVVGPRTRRLTEDGFELAFGTNFLGPFALTGLLITVLRRTPGARVTTVVSAAAKGGMRKINFDDLQLERSYGVWRGYCQSKLADFFLVSELARRCAAGGIAVLSNAAHPGWAQTNIGTSGPGRKQSSIEKALVSWLGQDAAQGALPTLRAATEVDAKAGSYYAPDGFLQLKGSPVLSAIPKPARDEATGRRLWEVAEELTGVRVL